METHSDTGSLGGGDGDAFSGLEILQQVLAGTRPAIPMHRALGMDLSEAVEGRAAFVASPGPDHRNLMGGVHGGWFASLLDSAMGCTLFTVLPRGARFTTLEMKVNLIRALSPGDEVTAAGRITHRGRRTAVLEADAWQGDRIVASATSTCLILN